MVRGSVFHLNQTPRLRPVSYEVLSALDHHPFGAVAPGHRLRSASSAQEAGVSNGESPTSGMTGGSKTIAGPRGFRKRTMSPWFTILMQQIIGQERDRMCCHEGRGRLLPIQSFLQ